MFCVPLALPKSLITFSKTVLNLAEKIMEKCRIDQAFQCGKKF